MMGLSEKQRNKLLNLILKMNEGFDSLAMRESIGPLLLDLLDADYYASFCWDSNSCSFVDGVSLNMDTSNLKNYDEYFQFHDPITHKLRVKKSTTLVTQVISQAELMKTEFFNDFLSVDGLYYGVNLYAYNGDANLGDLRIWRKQGRGNFDSSSIEILELLKPHFCNALIKAENHRQLQNDLQWISCYKAADAISKEENNVYSTLIPHIQNRFGFTKREAQIALLLSKGESDKLISDHLNIAFSTLRSHIKNIYRKLNIHNRTQLCLQINYCKSPQNWG